MPNSTTPLLLTGNFFIAYAWHARGHDVASTVSAAQWKQFQDRLAIADKALVQAWQEDPADPRAPTAMLTVARGEQKSRAQMEMWFKRAMDADPDNREACDAKLEFLLPQWYGSVEEMRKFALHLRDEANWYGQLPFELVTVYDKVSRNQSDPAATFRVHQAWQDVQSVYEPYLAAVPDDNFRRSRYAWYAARSGHWSAAKKQFALLGDNAVALEFGGAATMNQMRDEAMRKGDSVGWAIVTHLREVSTKWWIIIIWLPAAFMLRRAIYHARKKASTRG
jgi:hypothetical protein